MKGDTEARDRLRAHFDMFVKGAGDDPKRLFGVAKSASRLGLWGAGAQPAAARPRPCTTAFRSAPCDRGADRQVDSFVAFVDAAGHGA